jgi:hypothetical protein
MAIPKASEREYQRKIGRASDSCWMREARRRKRERETARMCGMARTGPPTLHGAAMAVGTASHPMRTRTGVDVMGVARRALNGRAARQGRPARQSRCRCGSGGLSPGADVAGLSPVPAQMWPRGRAQSRCRRGRGAPPRTILRCGGDLLDRGHVALRQRQPAPVRTKASSMALKRTRTRAMCRRARALSHTRARARTHANARVRIIGASTCRLRANECGSCAHRRPAPLRP